MLAVQLLTSCGGVAETGTGAPSPTTTYASRPLEPYLPLYAMSTDAQRVISPAAQELMAGCMEEQGFTYDQPYQPDAAVLPPLGDLTPVRWAELYGYGIAAFDRPEAGTTVERSAAGLFTAIDPVHEQASSAAATAALNDETRAGLLAAEIALAVADATCQTALDHPARTDQIVWAAEAVLVAERRAGLEALIASGGDPARARAQPCASRSSASAASTAGPTASASSANRACAEWLYAAVVGSCPTGVAPRPRYVPGTCSST